MLGNKQYCSVPLVHGVNADFLLVLFIVYIFVLTTRFFKLFLFLCIEHILISLKVFFILSDFNSNSVSSLNFYFISTFISRVDPGKMQHILSALLLLKEESTVEQALFFLFLIFWFDDEQITLLWGLPVEDKTVRHVKAPSEESVSSSSEATSAASLVLVTHSSLMTPSLTLIRVVLP